jgi:hypothetical protein
MIKAFLICTALIVSSFAQANLFRYKDADGKTVLNDSVPPEIRQNGYEVLSVHGRVLKVVPRALTADEIVARDTALAEKARLEAAKLAQREADEALLSKYGTPKDLKRMRDRKLDELNTYLKLKKNTLEGLGTKKVELETQAAVHEHAGQPIPMHLSSKIIQIEKLIEENKATIDRYVTEKTNFTLEMSKTLIRLEFLEKNPLK